MTVDRELLDLLGLSDAGPLHHVHTAEPPPERTAEAAGAGALLALLALPGIWDDVAPDVPAYCKGSYIAVTDDAEAEVLSGKPVSHGSLTGFDTRAERVVLRVHDEGRTYVIDGKDGRMHTYTLDALAALPDAGPPVAALDAPDIADWCHRTAAEPWLAEAAAACAAGPSSVDRLAAVGLLARLWTEPDAGPPPEATPRALAHPWARALPADRLAAAESDAVRRAWHLAERIAEVGDLPDDRADAEVADIVRDRDDLASVRRALRIAGAGDRLAAALAAADRVAAEHMSALADRLPSLAADPDADRWHAVAWQEPDAWWVGA